MTKLTFRGLALRRHFPIYYEDDVASVSCSSFNSDERQTSKLSLIILLDTGQTLVLIK